MLLSQSWRRDVCLRLRPLFPHKEIGRNLSFLGGRMQDNQHGKSRDARRVPNHKPQRKKRVWSKAQGSEFYIDTFRVGKKCSLDTNGVKFQLLSYHQMNVSIHKSKHREKKNVQDSANKTSGRVSEKKSSWGRPSTLAVIK